MAKFAIFADDGVKFFIQDTHRDFEWLISAACSIDTELTGDEEFVVASDIFVDYVVANLELQLPTTGREYFPLIYVLECDREYLAACTDILSKLEKVHFHHEGYIDVVRVPNNPWQRSSPQDVDLQDQWTWGCLMPLWFSEVGDRHKHLLIPFYQTFWTRRQFNVGQIADAEWTSTQWNIPGNALLATSACVVLIRLLGSNVVQLFTVGSQTKNGTVTWALPGGKIDRLRDTTWQIAAQREFEEEVNPSGSDLWSSTTAFASSPVTLSLQNNLFKSSTLNMSRPTLNFLVVKSSDTFVDLTEGGYRIQLPNDYVTTLPGLAYGIHGDTKRYWKDKSLRFVEHDRYKWVSLDLFRGRSFGLDNANEKFHNYLEYVAAALRVGSPPRHDSSELDSMLLG
jgi:8-oxo-dGTP pyrophosphatase MutT (NUDIX family)